MHWITKLANRVVGVERTKSLINVVLDIAYKWIRVKNGLKRKIVGRKENKYLFILCPPFCGSTLLNHIISSSSNVSSNNNFNSREGQQLPTVASMMFHNKKRWQPDTTFDWKFIKSEWEKYWDVTKPILLEKSPCSIVRAETIASEFDPAHFVVMYRNPYAHCEGIIRRNNWDATKAARFAMKCLRFQRQNINRLQNVVAFSYEELSENPQDIVTKLQQYLPELDDMQLSNQYPTQNVRNEKLAVTNLNSEKISRLTKGQLKKINIVFLRNKGLMNFFKYDFIEK